MVGRVGLRVSVPLARGAGLRRLEHKRPLFLFHLGKAMPGP